MCGSGKSIWICERQDMFENKTIDRIEKMLDDAIDGKFCESNYDETKLSRLESKWKKYLTTSQMAKSQLDDTKRNLEGLISDISHQTKTPMSNLRLYSELLSERLENREDITEEDKKLIEEIKGQTDKLDFLIQALTKMSRLESNIIEVKSEMGDVVSFTESVVSSMKARADVRNIKLCFDFESISELDETCNADKYDESDNKTVYERKAVCEACFDAKWTREALSNIIDNAIKYSPAGSMVTVSIIPYEMYMAISVKDEGMGISEKDSARIFERFYRGDEIADSEGVGLGLYLAREILRKENGYIKVKSELGEGAEFIMYLWRG